MILSLTYRTEIIVFHMSPLRMPYSHSFIGTISIIRSPKNRGDIMRLILLLLCSLSFFVVEAQADVIVLESNITTEIEINAPTLEMDVFFDAESDQVVHIFGDMSVTEGYFDVKEIILYSPDDEEMTRVIRFYSPDIHLQPYRLKTSGRYRIHIIARTPAQVSIGFRIRQTPILDDIFPTTTEWLYTTVETLDFTFTAEEGDTITSFVESEWFDAVLTLYDPTGEVIATDDDSHGDLNPEIGLFKIITTGTYRLVVHSYAPDDEGQFIIYLKRNPVPAENMMSYNEQVSVTFDEDTQNYNVQFIGSAGDVVALHIDDPEAIADVRIEHSADYGGVLVNTDESATSLYRQWDRFTLPRNNTYRLYVTPKEKGTSGEVSIQIEHLASNSLEAGEISVHVSDKEPIHRFTFIAYSNESTKITINQDNYTATTMPYRITVLNPSGSIIDQMTVDDFIGTFSHTNIFGIERLNGEVTIELEMLGKGPAWFDISVEKISGMG